MWPRGQGCDTFIKLQDGLGLNQAANIHARLRDTKKE